MNKEFINLTIKNISLNKNKKIIIFLILIFTILIIISSSCKLSIHKYINEGLKQDLSYRTLYVDFPIREKPEYHINILKKINHIVDAYDSKYYSMTLPMTFNEIQGNISLVGIEDSLLPNIVTGQKFNNEEEIVCPSQFLPYDYLEVGNNISRKDMLILDEKLNDNIEINYHIYKDNMENYNNKKILLKLVGTYKNSSSFFDENICYVKRSLIEKIYNDSYQFIDLSHQISSLMVVVDNIENIDLVKQDLYNQGYYASEYLMLDNNAINFFDFLTYFILGIVCFLGVVIISYIVKKDFKDQQMQINVYRAIGFTYEDLKKMFLLQNSLLGCLGILLGIVISLLIFGGLKYLVYVQPFVFLKFPISLDIISILLNVIIIEIILNLSTIKVFKQLNRRSIIYNLREE